MAFPRHLAAAVLILAATACSTLPTTRPGSPFANTTWQLHAIQSMDDPQATMRIPDPSRFTLRFGSDGRASLQLDCNRGTGTWEAKPAASNSGTLKFGPIAATRALCSPPHLDERVARDLNYVRSYLLKDGKLFMSLMADDGIYEWRPHRE